MKKTYARYALKLFVLMLAFLLPFAAYFGYVQSLPAQFNDSIMGTMRHKNQLLQDTSASPRLILAGGSSSPYGTDCESISQQVGMPTINVGTTVYLGVDFYISMLEKNMQKGDVIVLGPEHTMLSHIIDYQTVWDTIENFPEIWKLVPTHYWPELIGSYHTYASTKQDLHKRFGQPTSNYNPNFGPLGDVTAKRQSLLESGYNKEDPIALNADTLDEEVAKRLNAFYKKATQKGVSVYLIFAPVNAKALTTHPADWAALEAATRETVDIPLLAPITSSIMESKYFYDTNNHLTSEGADIYSDLLAASLRKMLG